MAELNKRKRVFCPVNQQQAFLVCCQKALGISDEQLAVLLSIGTRTLRDWRREKFSMQFGAMKTLSRKAHVPMPKGIEIKDQYWYVSKGARTGGIAVYKKYGMVGGDPEYRKKKWSEWWEREGKTRPHPIINVCKPIQKPSFSDDLAEFVGIVLGDGTMSQRQIIITLHAVDDFAYGKFIVGLVRKLFDAPVGYYRRKDANAIDYSISRIELVRFCVNELHMKCGNKVRQQVDIPDWVKKHKPFLLACIRGLVDTDGCIFIHRYRVRDKWYSYKKLSFSNRSMPLLNSVFLALQKFGMHPRIVNNQHEVRLESIADLKRYFLLIGSNNLKHLKRYKN